MLLFLVRFMQTGFWLRYLPASWLLFLLALGCRESALAAPGAVGLFLLILFYGKNEGFKSEITKNIIKNKNNILKLITWMKS